jgi:transposase
MDKLDVRPITCYERQELHRMKRQLSNHVNNRHARIVLLSAGGVRNREVAQRVERLRATYRRTGGVRHFLAAYDLETGTLLGRFYSRKTWIEFLRFLRWLRRRYPQSETLHIVMDNYSPHLKEEVWAWARANNVKFYLTPSNASWLNRIECQFTGLKKFAQDNSDYRSHEEQEQAIRRYLAWRNGRRAIAVEPWRSSLRTNATSTRRAAA